MRFLTVTMLVVALLAWGTASADEAKVTPRSDLQASFYGQIILDASYDASFINDGNTAKWVDPGEDDDGRFSMTARQTRLGIKFLEPNLEGAEINGKVEVDFYGGGEENMNLFMLRHAFMQVYWEDADFSILAGQTNDVISPLIPSTINYPVAWWAGNVGYRRPQLRLTKGFSSGSARILFEAAAARPIGGEDNGIPCFQGRAAFSFAVIEGRNVTIGFSGHTGKEADDTKSWSGNVDLSVPLGKKAALNGEAWMGENMDAYNGGIDQGVNASAGIEIESRGGWAALSLGPFDRVSFNVGGSMDDPNDDDLDTGARSLNTCYFGNFLYSLNHAVQFGVEVSRWETEYKDGDAWDSIRVQSAFMFEF